MMTVIRGWGKIRDDGGGHEKGDDDERMRRK